MSPMRYGWLFSFLQSDLAPSQRGELRCESLCTAIRRVFSRKFRSKGLQGSSSPLSVRGWKFRIRWCNYKKKPFWGVGYRGFFHRSVDEPADLDGCIRLNLEAKQYCYRYVITPLNKRFVSLNVCVCSGTKQYEVMRINIIRIDYWLIEILYTCYLDTCTFKY